jgi:hypothetical protein
VANQAPHETKSIRKTILIVGAVFMFISVPLFIV